MIHVAILFSNRPYILRLEAHFIIMHLPYIISNRFEALKAVKYITLRAFDVELTNIDSRNTSQLQGSVKINGIYFYNRLVG